MSGLTLTAGLSFSGGFTFTEAPVENTAAWFGGGYVPGDSRTASVNRITFATDTNTTSVRGPLSVARQGLAAASNTIYGWFAAGYAGLGPSGPQSRVDRITFATDTDTASVRGPLSVARFYVAAVGNTDYAWFGGGYGGESRVDRITYATDTATASVRGPLSVPRVFFAAAGNETDGWFAGSGITSPVPSYLSSVDRITYATDTATASVRGPLSSVRGQEGAAGNSDYGWFAGGGPGPLSSVDRITYATDTATASVRGPLSLARTANLGAAGNSTDGWFGGGYFPGGNRSTVDRITYATDTATASVRGPLSQVRSYTTAAGGIQ